MLAQHVGAGEHQVGRGHAFAQLAGQLEADDFGDQHRDRLAEHRGFRLDPAHAPAEHAQAVDHRGVAVGADTGIGIGDDCAALIGAGPHRLRDILQVHLVADAGAGRDRLEIVEALRSPFQEVVALAIAIIFDLDILFERLGMAEFVDHYRVVDDEVHGHQRVDLAGIAAELGDRIAHCRQIDDTGHAGEILQQHARGAILDLRVGRGVLLPVDNGLSIRGRDGEAAILEAQHVLEQHLHAERQARDIAQLFRRLGQRIIGDGASAHFHRRPGAERVLSNSGHEVSLPVYLCPKAPKRCPAYGGSSPTGRMGTRATIFCARNRRPMHQPISRPSP